jgi:hypothetical protein
VDTCTCIGDNVLAHYATAAGYLCEAPGDPHEGDPSSVTRLPDPADVPVEGCLSLIDALTEYGASKYAAALQTLQVCYPPSCSCIDATNLNYNSASLWFFKIF